MMNNTKIGGRISEINIIKFVLEKLNSNAYGVKFKMGLNENVQWYRPYNPTTKLINEEYVYEEETYELKKVDFIPTMIDIMDMGISSNLDFISGSATVGVGFLVNVDSVEGETNRIVIEEIRDSLRQGFFIYPVPQRPYANPNGEVTYKNFKFTTNTGTIMYGTEIEDINGKQFISLEFNIDIDFSDMLIFGNQYLVEMAIKKDDGSYSSWERMYPLNLNMAVANATQDKQELYLYSGKWTVDSTQSTFNMALFRYEAPIGVAIDLINVERFPISTIIKTNVDSVISYYEVKGNITPNEEQKAWETHSVWQAKGFSVVLDFMYREQYSFETVGILTHLFNDLVQKKYGYNIYKLRLSRYKLDVEGNWTLEYVLFERNLLMLQSETIVALGEPQPMTIPFAVSDLE